MTHHPSTALLLADSYCEVRSDAGQVWPRAKATATALDGSVRGRGPPAHSQVGAGRSGESQVLVAAALEAWRNLP